MQVIPKDLIPMRNAGKYFPVTVERGSLERWRRLGVRGVKLETVLIGSRRYVSQDAIDRFVAATQETDDQPTAPPTRALSERETEALRRKHGTPKPQ